MKTQTSLLTLLFAAPLLFAQDAAKVAPNNFKVLAENEHIRVVQDTLAPGETEAMHNHPAGWYYVTRPGTMRVTRTDGKTEIWNAKAGEQAWMDAEAPHTAENIGKTTIQYVLVEVKSAAKKE
ncbi:MAG: cupin domain-containing protein [Acidobacteriaceae bacterium]|nr:cupin domain-containing protein [Acidobacteriaceae bacterium]